MEFTVSQNEFLNAVNLVSRVVSQKNTLKILEGIYIKTEKDAISIIGSDVDMGIQTKIEAAVAQEGAFVVEAKLIGEITRKLPNSDLHIHVDENYQIKLTCSKSQFVLPGYEESQYPKLKHVEEINPFTLEASLFKKMIDQTSFSIAREELRKILTGLLIEVDREQLSMVAIDGYRMAIRKEKLENSDREFSVIVPGSSINEISRILGSYEGMIDIILDQNHILLEYENTKIVATLLTGEFIDYQRVIPNEFLTKVIVNTHDMYNSIERASLIARDGASNLVTFSIKEDLLVIYSHTEKGRSYEEIQIETKGNDLEIAFNAQYWLDALKAVEDEEITLNFRNNIQAMMILPVEDKEKSNDFSYMILPVRT